MGRKTAMYSKRTFIKAISLLFLVIMFIGIHSAPVEASRGKIDLRQEIEKSDLMHWAIVVHEKMFDVYVDRNAETIIVRGEADTQDEKDMVEEYVRSKCPSNYELFSSIHIKD
ncbi:MAG: hypothetical protein ACMUIL_09860 [bacterium]